MQSVIRVFLAGGATVCRLHVYEPVVVLPCSVKFDGPFSTSLNTHHEVSTTSDTSTRMLQLHWPTLWKPRWVLELSTLILSPLLDTLHFHLLQAREGTWKTPLQDGGSIHLRVDEGWVGRYIITCLELGSHPKHGLG